MHGLFGTPFTAGLLFALFAYAHAQSTATLQGKVIDSNGAVVPGVKVTARSLATGVERIAKTDNGGAYQIAALPAGVYRLEAQSTGFQTQVAGKLSLEVGRTVTQDFRMSPGDISQEVFVISVPNQKIGRASCRERV